MALKVPSDAQATLLGLVQRLNGEGREIEWRSGCERDYRPSRADLAYEVVDREKDTARLESADEGRREHRIVTVEACERAGWLHLLHERSMLIKRRRYYPSDPTEETWRLRQLDLTEDGVIALGLWRERKLHAAPAPLPSLTERETEIVELAGRALELGYALCAREPARKEAKRMRKAGWWDGCWVANSVSGLVPSPLAVVEVFPDRADGVPLKIEEPRSPFTLAAEDEEQAG